ARQRPRIRQRRRDLHPRRRRRARIFQPHPDRHGRHQRTDPGADGVPQLWRLEALAIRRHGGTRSGGRALLYAPQDDDRALARRHPRRCRIRHADDAVTGAWNRLRYTFALSQMFQAAAPAANQQQNHPQWLRWALTTDLAHRPRQTDPLTSLSETLADEYEACFLVVGRSPVSRYY